jgi:hypothetical protein
MPLVSCRDCGFYQHCGGLDGQAEMFGCWGNHLGSDVCEKYDWTCPCRPDVLQERWREVGCRWDRPRRHQDIAGVASPLPLYIPLIGHGSSRSSYLNHAYVAISPFRVLQGRGDSYAPIASKPLALRRHFRLRPDAKLLFVSVAEDHHLERYWAHRRKLGTPEALAKLGALGITVPNFSFFADAPKPHNLWNRARMLLVAEELSAAGLPVVPHIHALTSADWAFWAEFLKMQSGVRVVAKEFQTGNKNRSVGLQALADLEKLQERVQRPLHPVLVGGAKFLEVAARAFETFTVVDSMPFMRAMHRKVARDVHPEAPLAWEKTRLPEAKPVDALLQVNVEVYASWLERRLGAARGLSAREFQMALRLAQPSGTPCVPHQLVSSPSPP